MVNCASDPSLGIPHSTFFNILELLSVYYVPGFMLRAVVYYLICLYFPLQAKPPTHLQLYTSKVSNIFKSVPGLSV